MPRVHPKKRAALNILTGCSSTTTWFLHLWHDDGALNEDAYARGSAHCVARNQATRRRGGVPALG